MFGVLDSLHAGGLSGCDVDGAVVDEEDVGRWFGETHGGVGVDGGVGFCSAQAVREGEVREGGEPRQAREDAGFHCVSEVGEDAGLDAAWRKGERPVDHWLVGLGPKSDVGGEEVVEFSGREGAVEIVRDGMPVGWAREGAVVVGVAMGPVGRVESSFVGVEEVFEVLPGSGSGWAGEDEAVVKEDCVDGWHCVIVVKRVGG